jgi:hypothetical protein
MSKLLLYLGRSIFPLVGLVFALLLGCVTKEVRPGILQSSATILWSAPESPVLLKRSLNGDFFSLASFYEPQINKFNCGPATGTILLNALLLRSSKPKPIDKSAYPLKKTYLGGGFNPVFEKFTQNTFFNEDTNGVKTREVFYGKLDKAKIQDGGLMLAQFAKILRIHGLKVSIYPVETLDAMAQQKSVILGALKDSDTYIAINFDRKSLGQTGGGHISPLVAYDETSDSFLVMDVNQIVTVWFWVRASDLFSAMNTKDGNQFRGFLRVGNQ